jgi:3-deoxy-D-manno-octulosonate 8-phosphate phosphatase (KDO 8-P phosphatase)
VEAEAVEDKADGAAWDVLAARARGADSAKMPPRAAWARVKLLGFDVDGTLTDGSLTFDGEGRLYQTFNVRDGFGQVAARRAGLLVAWISGRPSPVAQRRFEELGGHHCILACADKSVAVAEIQREHGLSPNECLFLGDDLPDLPAWAGCGLRVAVADADPILLERADYVTRARGGRGAAREVIELVLAAQGHWDTLLESFTRQEWTVREGQAERPYGG